MPSSAAAAAGRPDRRRHGGQHRHRPRPGRQCARLSHRDRHPGHPEPGKEGHAAAVRRRACRGAGGSLRQSQQLRKAIPAGSPRELAKSEPNGAIWANQFDNVANRQAHIETTGPEIWEQTDGKVDGFVCAVGTGGTLAGIGMALKDAQTARQHRARRSAGRGALQLLHDRRAQIRRLVDHRRHRPRPHHRQSGRRADRSRLSDPRRRSGADRLRPLSTRGFASAARPASMSPARFAWHANSGPAIPS